MFYDKAMFVHDHEGTTALNYGVSGSVISPQKCAYYSINATDAPQVPAGARAYIFSIPETAPATLPVVSDNNSPFGYFRFFFPCCFKYNTARINNKINNFLKKLKKTL